MRKKCDDGGKAAHRSLAKDIITECPRLVASWKEVSHYEKRPHSFVYRRARTEAHVRRVLPHVGRETVSVGAQSWLVVIVA